MRNALLATAVLLALTAPLAADDGEPRGERGQVVVSHYLDLSPDQMAAWDQLLVDRHAAAEPLRTALATVEDELRALLEDDDPPLDQVGALVVEGRDLRHQLGDVQHAYVDGFVALLDDQQVQRFAAVRRAERLQPLLPAFRTVGLLPPR